MNQLELNLSSGGEESYSHDFRDPIGARSSVDYMLKTEEYLGVTVFVNTIDITEDTFHFTIIVDGESYVLTGAYNLSPVRINTSKVVNRKNIKITECLPDIKGKSNKNLLAKVETVLGYYKYNEHLTPNKD